MWHSIVSVPDHCLFIYFEVFVIGQHPTKCLSILHHGYVDLSSSEPHTGTAKQHGLAKAKHHIRSTINFLASAANQFSLSSVTST